MPCGSLKDEFDLNHPEFLILLDPDVDRVGYILYLSNLFVKHDVYPFLQVINDIGELKNKINFYLYIRSADPINETIFRNFNGLIFTEESEFIEAVTRKLSNG